MALRVDSPTLEPVEGHDSLSVADDRGRSSDTLHHATLEFSQSASHSSDDALSEAIHVHPNRNTAAIEPLLSSISHSLNSVLRISCSGIYHKDLDIMCTPTAMNAPDASSLPTTSKCLEPSLLDSATQSW